MNFQIQISKRQGTVPVTRDYVGIGEVRLRNIERDQLPPLQIAAE
jgi:cyclopropane-fatty-acyl-phospholipid synthase